MAETSVPQLALFAFDAPDRLCGVDEAGRGPLAGPVYAAAVVLDPERPVDGLRDSKQLTEKARERLALLIRQNALAYAVAFSSVAEIDEINILQASLLAMRRAVEALSIAPEEVWIDGNQLPRMRMRMRAVVGGDTSVAEISAASILAKTERDAFMRQLHLQYPHYGFDRHMGYSTPEHLSALAKFGVCPAHRTTFGPVRRRIAETIVIVR